MSIANYTDLQSQIASYLARTDLTAQIPDFIRLCEAKLQRKFTGVTTLSAVTTTNWMLTNNPDVYLYGSLLEAQPYLMDDARIATWTQIFTTVVEQVRYPSSSANFTNYTGLQAAVADWLNNSSITASIPNFIRLAEERFSIKFKSFTALSAGSPTNTVLTNYPDVYLYGTLAEAATYLNDKESLAVWEAELNKRLALIRVTDSTSTFVNYTGLQAAVADWAERPDLSGNVPDFIQLAETKLQRRFKSVTSLSAGNPTNWLLTGYPDVYLYGSLVELAAYIGDDIKAAGWKAALNESLALIRYPDSASNFTNYTGLQATIADWLERPDLATEVPNFIRLAESVLQRKFSDLTSLSAGSPTNWLLTSYPDIYLYASLLESAPYLKDDARLQMWRAEYDSRIAEVRRPSATSTFTSYTTFASMVADYLNRQDLANIIPSFIQMAQERLTRDLRTRQMLALATTTITSTNGTIGLPTDFLEMKEMHLIGNPQVTLEFQTPDQFFRNVVNSISGRPFYYTIIGNQFQLAPKPDTNYTVQMLYYYEPTFISATNASNIYLTNYPDALLYATLAQAEPYLKNDARVTTWTSLYESTIATILKNDDGGHHPNTPLTMRVR